MSDDNKETTNTIETDPSHGRDVFEFLMESHCDHNKAQHGIALQDIEWKYGDSFTTTDDCTAAWFYKNTTYKIARAAGKYSVYVEDPTGDASLICGLGVPIWKRPQNQDEQKPLVDLKK